MKTVRTVSLLLALSMLFLFSACGAETAGVPDTESPRDESGEAETVSEKTEKLTADFVSGVKGEKPDESFIAAYDRFAAELFARTRRSGENSLVSPLSVLYALAMTFSGAEGETLSQFLRAFDGRGDIDVDKIGASLAGLAAGLYKGESAYTDIANSIWVKNRPDLRLKDGFIERNERYFRSDVYAVPFNQATLGEINGWVSANTGGMIKEILKELPEDTVMCLVNAVLFEAKWARQYTQKFKMDFTKADGKKIKVDMLYSYESEFISTENAKGFIKNYIGNGYSFVAVLPNGTLDDYMETFDGAELSALLSSRKDVPVMAETPAFKYDFSDDLSGVLRAMGITDAFTDNADFSGMFEEKTDISISKVIHKTRIEVDTEGTRAAAATAVVMTEGAAMIEHETVILNRPFLYMIIDANTDTPMFIGTYEG